MGRVKEYTGTIINDNMLKTRVVRTVRITKHPKYHKVVKRYNRFKVHDEHNETKAGDLVKIAETRPLSKDKRYRIIGIIKKAAIIHSGEDEGKNAQ